MDKENHYIVRDAEEKDLDTLLRLLSHLTETPALPQDRLRAIFEERKRSGIVTKVAIDPSNGAIAGTASLLVERKYTRGGLRVGHIEDVVTDPNYRGKGVALQILHSLCNVAASQSCYKVILDCSDKSVAFYENRGFKKCENQMRMDLPSHM